jgi:hypothetical protein
LDGGLCGRSAATIATVLPIAAATALLLHLLRRSLMAQFRLRPVLHLGRDAGLADPVGFGLGADCRKWRRRDQKCQGGGRDQKSAHVTSP